MTVAALYVAKGGVYFDPELTDVDPWDEERDARNYRGPWPVVAHPPCARWSVLAALVHSMGGAKPGEDGGCFASALKSVRSYGGVLEHPYRSAAWSRFGLLTPSRGCWSRSLFDFGWVTEVSQVAYGHRARKITWLYYVGKAPPTLDWSDRPGEAVLSGFGGSTRKRGRPELSRKARSATPIPFRDMLLNLARSCGGAR